MSSVAASVCGSLIARVRATPAWAWLCALVVCAFGGAYLLSRRTVAPWIWVDELIYSELAKSFAAGGHFAIRGQANTSYGFVYPILIAPAYRLFASVPSAYAAAKAINALLMSLAAVPAYLLARRVLSARLSLLAALLTVAVPSMVYVGVLMTENAFYPLYLTCVLLLVRVLERPTPARQVVLLLAIGVATATRVQAIVLLVAALTAPPLLALFQGRSWRSLTPFRVLYGLVGGLVALVLLGELARGRSPVGLLGAYQVAGHSRYGFVSVARQVLYHASELDLYVGIVGVVALLLLSFRARSLPPSLQAFVAAALTAVVWTLLEVAAFASKHAAGRIEERNLFYAAPLFFVALLAWIELGLPRPRRRTAALVVAAGVLPAFIPFTSGNVIGPPAESDTLMMLPWWWINVTTGIPVDRLWLLALGLGLLAALLAGLVPRRLALVLPLLLLVYYGLSLRVIENWTHGVRQASIASLYQGIGVPDRDWIDRAVGASDDSVPILWCGQDCGPQVTAFDVWQNEFFSRSVGQVYDLSQGGRGTLPAAINEKPLLRDRHDVYRVGTREGPRVRTRYVVANTSLYLDGDVVAQDPHTGLALIRLDGPLRTGFLGVYADSWTRPRAVDRRASCATGSSLELLLASDGSLFRRPQTVVARAARRLLGKADVPPATTGVRWRLPLHPVAGSCSIELSVTPTAVPARVLPGSQDERSLGVRVLSYRYVAP
ncbi:MAG: glycosyltransferase family 39 protein [Gaiellaceae bacterium]